MGSTAIDKLETVRSAREKFLSHGIIPAGVVTDTIIRSWQRSAERGIGIERGETRCTPRYDLLQRRENNHTFLTCSQPVLESLYHEIAGTSSMVLLADSDGVVLHSIGDPDFVEQAQKVYLKPGGIWSEGVNGTNAIGTALEEQMTVQVHSSEHFIDKNRFLSCSATPIFNPKGGILGALDVSGDYRVHQQHTTALVRLSAQMIENQMFAPEFPEEIIISFHVRPEFIGSLYEGIAVFAPDGRFVAANRCALLQLGLDRSRMIGHTFSSLFKLSLAKLLEQTRFVPQPVLRLPLVSGAEVYGRVWSDTATSPVAFLPTGSKASEAVKPPAQNQSAEVSLSELELGDPKMQAVISKALRVIGHEIPIMIEGESGTGKELLARGLHQAGPRRNGPLFRSTVPLSRRGCLNRNSSVIRKELLPEQNARGTSARSGRPTTARCSSTKSATCRSISRPACCGCFRIAQFHLSAEPEVIPVNIAVIRATNRRVRDAVAEGRFREDLYYRLNGLLLTVPALRERDDQVQLSRSILNGLTGGSQQIGISAEVLRIFGMHPWPGNIRQMHNLLRTAVALLGEREEISLEDLPEDFLEQAEGCKEADGTASLPTATKPGDVLLVDMEARVISTALERSGGNIAETARKPGISRNTLYRRLRSQLIDCQ